MPNYDYECPDCGKTWENFHLMDDRENETCGCGKKAEIRVTSVNVHVWKPFVEANLSWNPVQVDDPKTLRGLCKDKKVDFDSVVESRRKMKK